MTLIKNTLIFILFFSFLGCTNPIEEKLCEEEWILFSISTEEQTEEHIEINSKNFKRTDFTIALKFEDDGNLLYSKGYDIMNDMPWNWVNDQYNKIQFNDTVYEIGIIEGNLYLLRHEGNALITKIFNHFENRKWDDKRVDDINRNSKPYIIPNH